MSLCGELSTVSVYLDLHVATGGGICIYTRDLRAFDCGPNIDIWPLSNQVSITVDPCLYIGESSSETE